MNTTELLLLASLLIGAIVRLLKSDSRLPIDIPARWRPIVAGLLGIVAGVLDLVVEGQPVRAALIAVLSPAIATFGHGVVIEGMRGGREVQIPGLTRRETDDSDPPKPKHRMPVAMVMVMCFGCGGGAVSTIPEAQKIADELCSEYGELCVGSELKEDVGADEYLADFYWGRNSYGEVEIDELPGVNIDVMFRFICWDDAKCAEDIDTCAGVLMHEFGHSRVGSSQVGADCWAFAESAERGTPEYGEALAALVCSWGWESERCQTLVNGRCL